MKEYLSLSDTEVEVRLSVTPSERGLRLDRFIQRMIPRLSRQRIQRIIEDSVRDQDGRTTKPSRMVKVGDVFWWRREVEADTGEIPSLDVLYEDERMLVVNKPESVVVHPTAKVFRSTVTAWLNENRPDAKIAHRLDRDTSGVFVCGKGDFTRYLKAQFAAGTMRKTYLAVVKGVPSFDSMACSLPMRLDDTSSLGVKMCIDEVGGMQSLTLLRVLQQRDGLALVEAKPRTGRQHQIRVHLHALGLPLLGDKLYGVPEEVFKEAADHGVTEAVLQATGARRHMLHAYRIEVPLPEQRVLSVSAPLPADFEALFKLSDADSLNSKEVGAA